MEQVDELLDFALELAAGAGEKLQAGAGSVDRNDIGYKGWRNLVTQFDLEVETWVTNRIQEVYPDHGILAEEGFRKDGTGSHRWVIDPLDGTTNFVHAHPFYCVSIGLEDEIGPAVGVIFAPELGLTYKATRGGGAFRNDRPIHVSEETEISRALMASGFAYGKGTGEDRNLRNWARLGEKSRGLRRCGSAALDLAFVADGRYDAFWELGLNPWDVSAGALLVVEAGGRVTDCYGGPNYHDGESIASSNGKLHDELLENLEDS